MFVAPLLAVTIGILPHAKSVGKRTAIAQATAAPSPSPIATATPGLYAIPESTAGIVLPAAPAVEPGFQASSTKALPSGDIAGVDGPFVGLTAGDAVGMALSRDTDLSVSQSNRRIARYQIVQAKGAYDLVFQVQPEYQYETTPAISAFQSGPNGQPITQITTGATGGFTGNTTSGGRYSATTTAQHVSNNSTFNSYDPYYQTALALNFTQPIARGLAIDDRRRQLELSKINANLADANALSTASTTVDNVLIAYYNLVAAWKNVAIQEDALRQAKAQSESNARLVKQGQAAPVDVVESDTQVNEFQENVYSAIENVASLQNALKSQILNDPADPIWTANLVPTTPITNLIAEPKVDDVVVAALKARPEIAQLRENLRAQDVNIAYAKDQQKPQIDLNFNVTENGFAGTPTNPNANPFVSVIGTEITSINNLIQRSNLDNPALMPLPPISAAALATPLQPGTIGGLGQSYATAFQGKFPQYNLTATLAFPLQNRSAKAAYAIELERRQSLVTQEVGVIQRVQTEARNAVQQYRSARARLAAAAAGRQAAESVASSEIRKFKAGQSTTFLVLQRQVTLANERGRELQAQSDVQKALVELDRVSGAILANNAVDASQVGTAPHGAVPDLRLKTQPAQAPSPVPGARK